MKIKRSVVFLILVSIAFMPVLFKKENAGTAGPEALDNGGATIPDSSESAREEYTDAFVNTSDIMPMQRTLLKRNRGRSESVFNPKNGVEGTLSGEEGLQVAKALEATAVLQSFLDEDEEAKALMEARKLVLHPNREVRIAALMAMQWIGAAAVDDIAVFFADEDEEIRRLAEETYWSAIDEITEPALKVERYKAVLQSPNIEMRIEALDRIIYLPDILSFKVIAVMLNDTDQRVRELAQDQLEFISEETFQSEQDALAWFDRHKVELEEFEMN